MFLFSVLFVLYLQNVTPDPSQSCGPYQPVKRLSKNNNKHQTPSNKLKWKSNDIQSHNLITKMKQKMLKFEQHPHHDTIAMVVIDENSHLAAGTSTNGANHKVPG